MKRKIIMLSLIIFLSCLAKIKSAINSVLLNFVSENVLEASVPEYKEFNEKHRKLFKIKDQELSFNIRKDLKQNGNDMLVKLRKKLQDPNQTIAQRQIIINIIANVSHKLSKI